ncbi:uncharacterized protein LOC131940186 isoform X2 [Physella acuta]|nr:uncharacterized protein LOC131940186 isoform X2 [Physella acuta]
MQVVLRDYLDAEVPGVMFIQRFPQGLAGSRTEVNRTVSGFPSFHMTQPDSPVGYLSFGSQMFGDQRKKFGKWGPQAEVNDGLDGSGPLALFDKTGHALVISTYNNFMAASLWQDKGAGLLNWGVMGGVDSIPAGFELKTFAFCSQDGVGAAFSGWGDVMKRVYNKTKDVTDYYQSNDLSLTHLGYWTDNGAYYYYHTEDSKDYETTLLDVKHYSIESKIPYRYMQLDSWFYPKDNISAVTTWDATPQIFPKGIKELQGQLMLPLVAHNRYWSVNTTYAKQRGGDFDFIVDPKASLPVDEKFWEFLFGHGALEWGLFVYEQDWLNIQVLFTDSLQSNLTLGRLWLTQMGSAADRHGLKIQYCMAMPRHALQSLEIPAVTQARVSNDYHLQLDQWKIGVTSHFADAMGVAPSKDTFWTTASQPGNTYNKQELYPTLQTVVSVLSKGPVGPGDMIGGTNRSVLMGCCNEEGLILKPTSPAKAVDDEILEMAFQDGQGVQGEVWTTYSTINGLLYGVILAANLTADYVITPQKAGFLLDTLPTFQTSVFYRLSGNDVTTVPFNSTGSFTIKVSDCWTNGEPFCLFYTAPILSFGSRSIVLLGDLTKYVPMSELRVVAVKQSLLDFTVALRGRPGDMLHFSYMLDGVKKDINYTANTLGCVEFSILSDNNGTIHSDLDCRFQPMGSTTAPPPMSSTVQPVTIVTGKSVPTPATMITGRSVTTHKGSGSSNQVSFLWGVCSVLFTFTCVYLVEQV